ncbi:hypothetical protein WISP_00434 [Willisornis vidua]|uniref:Serine/threonine-protein phosphatase 2A 55 kDa regulatory subunit B n=1 Tax=Willisornis vidua TaxID=1566151 RepID=A0ABQ9DZW6_9PASS|nr:hypothetical protein WISP_00434 [Willisornis vidua]
MDSKIFSNLTDSVPLINLLRNEFLAQSECPCPVQVPTLKPMDLMVEASPRRIFANAHTYHINSISVNSDCATYLSADDLRINLWHLEVTNRSFSILCAARGGNHSDGTN